jgi:hypothetical protein
MIHFVTRHVAGAIVSEYHLNCRKQITSYLAM